MDDFPAACLGGRGIFVVRGRFRELRPAAGSYRNRKFRIQNGSRAAACGGRARLQGTAGLRRREAAARTVLTDRFQLGACPQPSGRACDVEEQPSARGGAAGCCALKGAMKNEELKMTFGSQLAKKPHTSGLADARSGPSPGEAAASMKPQIHDSKLKEAASSLGYYSRSSRSLRSDRTSNRELRAFAAGGCGPHDLLRGRFQ